MTLVLAWLAMVGPTAARVEGGAAPAAVVRAKGAAFAEVLAAKEIRRYVYLRTGKLLPVIEEMQGGAGGLIVVGCKDRPAVQGLLTEAKLKAVVAGLAPEQYVLKTIDRGGRPIVLVAGGDPVGTLYGAYRFAEHLGVRFYLHGDVVPDEPAAPELPRVDEVGRPLFDRRGIQPFHDFPEGPDWWNADAYRAILAQLPKLRMNFFGLHTYPQGKVGPEPTVWIGTAEDFGPDGKVKFSYPSRHFTTRNVTGAWGYQPTKTSDYAFGAAELYDRDDYAADTMRGTHPWTEMSPDACNALFDRMGGLLADAFGFARRLGIKTCIGTETPLVVPSVVKERLQTAGKNPADPAVLQQLYEGIFQRIMKTHPLDYYWFWTPETWTWAATKQEQIDATLADYRAAIAAAEKVNAPFTLATCGWVLGPAQDRALFDNVLPKVMPMSCINREVGHAPVEPGFAKVQGRPKWAIPWLEDDPAMIIPQLWAGRMRKDAADALSYGCTGLLGIHWRTRILGPNVAALARAAWDQHGWKAALSPQAKPAASRPPEGPEGGKCALFPNNRVAGTDDAPLYQSVRYDVGAYRLDVPNGKYTVVLKFCEPHYGEVHKRVFGVRIQARPVIDSLDIFRKIGKNKALDYTFPDIEVSDGRLVIDFVYQLEYPCIAAIVVQGDKATRKINCGGVAYKDYAADWPAGGASGRRRDLPAEDFYADWALAEFGPEAAKPAAELLARIDGRLPRPSTWVNGPGGIKPDPRPWEEAAKQYAFVDELAALRPRVQGVGNLERFDYWLNNFRYLRSVGQVNCTWARFNEAMAKVKAEKDPGAQKRLARQAALPLRRQLVAQVAELHRHLLATVSTPGELGTVTNWQQHILPTLLTAPGQELAKVLGEDLPADALSAKTYQGPPRLFVPVVRTSLLAGERLGLTVILAGATSGDAAVYWRPLATGEFGKMRLAHVARGVYTVTLPPEATKADFEYYVQAGCDGGQTLRWPPTAPALNQTVVVVERQ
jgi:hypothetical protein